MAGGYVSSGSHMFGPSRVWTDRTCQKPGLAVSRSIGDLSAAPSACAEAVVTERKLTAADRALIVASDGSSSCRMSRCAPSRTPDDAAAAVALINTAGERGTAEGRQPRRHHCSRLHSATDVAAAAEEAAGEQARSCSGR